jgi:hypothetical protein
VGFADAVGSVSDAMAEMRRRMASTSSVARSATGSTERREMQMENSEVADAQQQPPEAAAAAAEPAAAGESAAPAPFERAKQIVQLCALAGLTARQALAFLKPESSIDSIRQELLDARAAEGGPEIHAHVLPEAGAMGGKDPDDSPLVKVAEARAAARGGK